MKILFVAHLNPLPCNAGNRARILNMIRELVAWGHEVHYAYLNSTKLPADHVLELESQLGGGKFHDIEIRSPRELETIIARGLRKVLRLVNHEAGHRVPLDHRYDPAATEQLSSLHDRQRFDAVFVEYVFMSKAFGAFAADSTLRVLDTHDAFGDRHQNFLEVGKRPSWYATTPEEEEAGFRRADVVIAIQDEEAEGFRRRLGADGARVHTVSHFLDLSRRIDLPNVSAAAFIGAVNAVNLAALEFLTREVMPLVLNQRPDFKLFVAGLISGKIQSTESVESCGFVDHVADLYARAPLSLNPMVLGTGINIKVLDAMACGVPTVSTEKGARGLAPRFRRGVRTVPDRNPHAFAAAVLEILADGGLHRDVGEMAFADAIAWNEEQRSALRDVLQLVAHGDVE